MHATRCHLGELGARLPKEGECNLNRVIGGLLEQKRENLECENLMRHLLIDKMCNELARCRRRMLVIAFECALELNDETTQDELADLREL